MNDFEQLKQVIAPILTHYGVRRCSVFGSVARGESNEQSDIDFLVELPPQSTLLDLVGLELDLKETLKRDVDIVTFRSLHPLLKSIVEREAIDLKI